MDKKNTNAEQLPKTVVVIDRRTVTARGSATRTGNRGIPQGAWTSVVIMGRSWRNIPNTLLEDEEGQLWLAFTKGSEHDLVEKEGFEPVDVEGALTWAQRVSELADEWSGDIADVCRIALAEIRRVQHS